MLRLIPYSLKIPLLQRAFSPARNVGAVTPNRSQSSHSLMAVAAILEGRNTLPHSSIVMMSLFISYAICVLPNDWFSLSPSIVRSWSIFCVVIFAYSWVVTMFVCPNTRLTLSIGIPLLRARVANPCLAQWKERSNMSNGNEKKAQRNLLVINYFSIFFNMSKTQKSEAY